MTIPAVSRLAVVEAMAHFDRNLRAIPEWRDWFANGNYEHAILHEHRQYPVKEIISVATGYPKNQFSGGPEANDYLQRMGFTIVPLRPKGQSAQRNPPWTYEEIVLAMDLYVRRGLPSPSDPDVLDLSVVLNTLRGGGTVADPSRYRNPNGVHLKLANFRARERPGHGMSHGNRLEEVVWVRFKDAHELLHAEAEAIRSEVADGDVLAVGDSGGAKIGFLRPFAAKADLSYQVEIEGGIRKRDRNHESLVNAFADWLTSRGLRVARNRAIDLAIEEPLVIIEAKQVSDWALAVRQALGQLYEYRYFQVVKSDAHLMFLASEPVPERWRRFLEEDREVNVAWRIQGKEFHLTGAAYRATGLRTP